LLFVATGATFIESVQRLWQAQPIGQYRYLGGGLGVKAAGNNRRGHRDATAIGDEEEEDADEPPQRQP
jgi:hypothetical protein